MFLMRPVIFLVRVVVSPAVLHHEVLDNAFLVLADDVATDVGPPRCGMSTELFAIAKCGHADVLRVEHADRPVNAPMSMAAYTHYTSDPPPLSGDWANAR